MALEQVGAERLQTSGQESSALEGLELIRTLREKAANLIIIMPGGGMTLRNVQKIVALTGANEIRLSCRRTVESGMTHRNSRVFMGGAFYPPEYQRKIADESGIRSVRQAVP